MYYFEHCSTVSTPRFSRVSVLGIEQVQDNIKFSWTNETLRLQGGGNLTELSKICRDIYFQVKFPNPRAGI